MCDMNRNKHWVTDEGLVYCPFCGSDQSKMEETVEAVGKTYQRVCLNCDARGPLVDSEEDDTDYNAEELADEAWNYRPIESALQKEAVDAKRTAHDLLVKKAKVHEEANQSCELLTSTVGTLQERVAGLEKSRSGFAKWLCLGCLNTWGSMKCQSCELRPYLQDKR